LRWIVTDQEGAQIAAAGPSPVTDTTSSLSTLILEPRCWSPDHPHLHWAEGRLETDDGQSDAVRIRFGVTRAEFRPEEGFFLDGKRVDLHGCNRHESIPGLGNALPREIHQADARLLKDYGCNFVRLSHYPQHPSFLDACDDVGILVYAEIASWKSVSSSRPWRRAARRQMRDLILRDRHHPSVILWGMGNESRSRVAYLELSEIARDLDPARPVTYAENHLYRARREKTVGIPEVWSINYELDKLEDARDACSLRNVVVAECCNFQHSSRGSDGAELTQVATLEYEWSLMADRPYLAGYAVWCFSDYATEYRKRFRRQSGLFDAWRQPKMAAELFRARYATEPFLAPFVVDNESLHLFTNCDRVHIGIDGSDPIVLNKQIHHVLELDRAFSKIVVDGEREGVSIREILRAWGAAETVVIALGDHPRPGRTVPVGFSIHDASANPVRNWNGQVMASVEGDAQLHTYTESGQVPIASGEGRTYLQFGTSGKESTIYVTADGLKTATLKFKP
jgi:beta-galactosidase